MAKRRRRREQHHLRQESTRKRSYTLGGGDAQGERYQPGFPMNILGNLKAFSIIGAFIAVIMVVSAILFAQTPATPAADVDTPTPSATEDPNATPTATPTEDPRRFSAAEQVVDPEKQYSAKIITNMGEFEVNLFADIAPQTVNSFVFLAQKGFFDGLTFHRVIDNFVIQGGDPKGDGTGGPGYSTQEEPNEIHNKRGTISMAKAGGASSFGSQFFINLKDNTALDFDSGNSAKFYPFGEVTRGMDVVDAIARVEVGPDSQGQLSKPTTPVMIEKVEITEK